MWKRMYRILPGVLNITMFHQMALSLSMMILNTAHPWGAQPSSLKDSIAFKWADEIKETRLQKIEWSASRTGLINPIAIFEPVELEGSTVSRASVHNLSILENLQLGIETALMYIKRI